MVQTGDPRTVAIYRMIMEWLEKPTHAAGPVLRIPVMAQTSLSWKVKDSQGSLKQPTIRVLAFIRGVDHGGLHAQSMDHPSVRVYYHANWRSIADIEEILRTS
jgi:hypothetical protein